MLWLQRARPGGELNGGGYRCGNTIEVYAPQEMMESRDYWSRIRTYCLDDDDDEDNDERNPQISPFPCLKLKRLIFIPSIFRVCNSTVLPVLLCGETSSWLLHSIPPGETNGREEWRGSLAWYLGSVWLRPPLLSSNYPLLGVKFGLLRLVVSSRRIGRFAGTLAARSPEYSVEKRR